MSTTEGTGSSSELPLDLAAIQRQFCELYSLMGLRRPLNAEDAEWHDFLRQEFQTIAPSTFQLWKTGGWVVLSHFEMTLQTHRIRQRLLRPCIRMRNRAICPVEWDSRIPVGGSLLEVFAQQDAREGHSTRVPYKAAFEDESGEIARVQCLSHRGGWATLGDAARGLEVDYLRVRESVLVDHSVVLRILPENGHAVASGWYQRFAVAANDLVRFRMH
ncbi:hypothetical protein EV121DRAFT_286159 [Schizophyllum commune]